MKRFLLLAAFSPAVLSVAFAHTEVRGGGEPIAVSGGNCEVVCRPDVNSYPLRNSTYLWTAIVATNLLSQALDAAVPIVTRPTPGKVSVILDAARAKTVGLDATKLPRDGFFIRAQKRADGGADVFVTGVDDSEHNMAANILLNGCGNDYEHATLFGVYELLERFAGVRFYFPGELGTIFPKRGGFTVPDGVEIVSWPDYKVRYYSSPGEQGDWFEPIDRMTDLRGRAAMRLRHRMETEHIPCCHGQNQLSPAKRFRKTHPEYFRIDEKGVRSDRTEDEKRTGFDVRVQQMCHTSGWWDEIAADAVSYFRGEPASVRKVPAYPRPWKGGGEYEWGPNAVGRRYFDVMPQDGMHKCFCANCQAAYAKAKNPEAYATELIWGQTARVAQAVKDAGLSGTICQMVYGSYRDIPDFGLPDNLAVMVGVVGPWSEAQPEVLKRQTDEVRAWGRKLGGKVFLWTYVGKYECLYLDIPDIPHAAPHACGRYYKAMAPDIIGAYAESKSDRYLYHYLDFHLFSKIAWDSDVDPEAIIAEHDRLMFGAGAAEMRAFFDILERKWVYEIAGHTVPTPLGDVASPPDEYSLWNVVFSPKVFRELHAHVTAALAKVPQGSLEARRIRVMKEEFMNRMGRTASAYQKRTSVALELKRREERKVVNLAHDGLIPRRQEYVDPSERVVSSEGLHLHLDESNQNVWSGIFWCFNGKRGSALKPRTRYRVSYFAKAKDLKAVSRGGGHYLMVRTPEGQKGYPDRTQITGTFDWTHFAYEFETGDVVQKGNSGVDVALRSHAAVGDIWFDGICVEEIRKEGK